MKTALILGAGGFIGGHLTQKLHNEGYKVTGVDQKQHEYTTLPCQFTQGDLRDPNFCKDILQPNYDEIYQLAADMGGAGYIFTGTHDADIMHNSATINLNILNNIKHKKTKIFYSSSACIYPERNQQDPNNPNCAEDTAYPAAPDSEYGWEKIFSERLYQAYHKNYGLQIRIARFHNIYGPQGAWNNGKEKSPAALCRKVAQNNQEIEIWGNGQQTRSYLYIDECLTGIQKLMQSNYTQPINIGSEEMISINNFAKLIMQIAGKQLTIKNIDGPQGVMGRSSNNKLIYQTLGWQPTMKLKNGITKTYHWIQQQLIKTS